MHIIINNIVFCLVGLNPVPEEGGPGVDAGHVVGTAHAPRDQADHGPPARQSLAHQGRSTVTGAGVLAHLTASADLLNKKDDIRDTDDLGGVKA